MSAWGKRRTRNRGRQMLSTMLDQRTQRELAAMCGASQSTISRLAAGDVPDSVELRRLLEAKLGIHFDAWDRPELTPDDYSAVNQNRG